MKNCRGFLREGKRKKTSSGQKRQRFLQGARGLAQSEMKRKVVGGGQGDFSRNDCERELRQEGRGRFNIIRRRESREKGGDGLF